MNLLVTAAATAASSVALPSSALGAPRPKDSDVVDVAAPAGEIEVPTMSFAELRRGPLVHDGSFPEYPPEIFGKLPEGFVLEEQQIEMLCFWHQKAIDVIKEFLAAAPATTSTDEKLTAYCGIKNRILGAVLATRPATSGQVAAQLRAVVAEIESLSNATSKAPLEEVLDRNDIFKMSADLTSATAQIVPKKHVGPLQRGRKLTRAGLLTRYQSFLVQELETVSWNLYGERDYAKDIIFFDSAVGQGCKSADHYYPFFDEKKLPARARAVLGSLEIDTDLADDRKAGG
jgi:hypothetical protein